MVKNSCNQRTPANDHNQKFIRAVELENQLPNIHSFHITFIVFAPRLVLFRRNPNKITQNLLTKRFTSTFFFKLTALNHLWAICDK